LLDLPLCRSETHSPQVCPLVPSTLLAASRKLRASTMAHRRQMLSVRQFAWSSESSRSPATAWARWAIWGESGERATPGHAPGSHGSTGARVGVCLNTSHAEWRSCARTPC